MRMSLSDLIISPALAAGSNGSSMTFWESFQPPEDISTYGHLIDWLFNYITIMDTFYFVLVCVGLFGFCWKYSAKRSIKPYYTYGNKKGHLITTMVIGVAVFLSIDINIARISNDDLMNTFWNYPDPKKEEVLRIEVLAQQWAWNYRYAGPDELFNTADDVVTLNDLRVPANKKILFHLTSKDVIHSFSIPNARMKVDTIPGRITRMWVELTKPGKYEIACAEMCGTHHYLMKSNLTVYSEEDFLAWQADARELAVASNDVENPDEFWGWKWEGE
jgi:cytochrome c oxidase subunit 2